MTPEVPFMPTNKKQELRVPVARLTDEKISDDAGTEAKSDSALAPAGLNNPFWN
jgi:hypothetical protein